MPPRGTMSLLLAVLWLLAACAPVWAVEVPVFIRGETLQGAPVHAKPAGAVLAMLPRVGEAGFARRNVAALSQHGDWVRIRFDNDSTGFVRSADLGACTVADSPTPLLNTSRAHAYRIATVPPGTPVYLVAVRAGWAQVEYRGWREADPPAKPRASESRMPETRIPGWLRGWLPAESLSLDPALCWLPGQVGISGTPGTPDASGAFGGADPAHDAPENAPTP